MIQNYCPEAMRLNTLSRKAENTVLPRAVVLPPTGGQTFDIHDDGAGWADKFHADYLAAMEDERLKQQQQQQQQQQEQQQEQQSDV